MFFQREIAKTLIRYKKFPVIALLGPRQSGKTTFAKNFFQTYDYVNLENPEQRSFAQDDPNRFLKEHTQGKGLVIDEFQHVPELLSYIQLIVDETKRPGFFVLTGSQNFLMNQSITQSLAGRVGILTLLPLSMNELAKNHLDGDVDTLMFNGSYPRLYEEKTTTNDFYLSYIQDYIKEDMIFWKFMRLCAARVGQLVNFDDLATILGVDQRKIKQWFSILKASYLVFLLEPHYQNFNKRIIKTPKLYFYDTGLACALLDIKNVQTLKTSPHRGHLFENLVLADFYKQFYHNGISPSLYFWRDRNGRIEVDCLVDCGDRLLPIEIKSGETIREAFFDGLTAWSALSESDPTLGSVVYAGEKSQNRTKGRVVSWKAARRYITDLFTS